jgi:acyl-CoA synthetase (NDP forming)
MRMAGPSLEALFHPRSVAVFGSVKRDKIGHQLVTQLVAGGFPGTLAAVNPKGETPEGFPAVPGYAALSRLPSPVDLALVAVPAPFVVEVVRACGSAGVPFAVVLSSGFSETGHAEEEQALKQAAAQGRVRLIGPNCAGIMNTASRLYASIEVRALPGRTAFITQSGAVGGAVLGLARERGIGFSTFVSYGNRADIGEVELLEHLAEDPETDVIGLYLESLTDGRAFMRTVQRVTRRKPVVIIKAGRSSSGLRAASSHTGSLAGSDAIFQAMVAQSGALRVAGMEEMLDLCDGLTRLPPLRGGRVAIITNSGGPGILTSDRAEELGLEVAQTPEALCAALREFLPAHCALANPIDLTVEGTRENYSRALRTVLACPREGAEEPLGTGGFDAAIAINVATPFLNSVALADGILEAVADTAAAGRPASGTEGKPVAAVFMAGEIVQEGSERLKKGGVPVFPTGERAAAVLAGVRDHYRRQEQPRPELPPELPPETLPLIGPVGGQAAASVLEPELVAFLEGEGFPFPARAFVRSAADLPGAAERLGFPLVMKVVSPRILHKSEVGGVVLSLRTAEAVEQAYRELHGRLADQDLRGVMLYRQVEGGLEMIAGVKRDPTFGPVVLAGAGGVLTELLQDAALRIAPFEREEALEMIATLRAHSLLAGYRGSAPLDREALAGLLARLSRLAARYPAIRELDFNPVFVQERGVVIGDVRLLT